MSEATTPSQFVDPAQQREAASLGMWLFLATEVMFFGGLFMTYAYYHELYPAAFASASRHGDFWLGSLNTAVLLLSSFTMAQAVQSARGGERGSLAGWLLITMVFGAAFLGIKGLEYYRHIQEHLWPGPGFTYDPRFAHPAALFFWLYFAMTGLHALHMMGGIVVLAVMLTLNARGRITTAYYTPVELAGLYWHFVDVIWIFLFPMLYLVGGHS